MKLTFVEYIIITGIILVLTITGYMAMENYYDNPIYKCFDGYRYKGKQHGKVYYPLTTKFGPVTCDK